MILLVAAALAAESLPAVVSQALAAKDHKGALTILEAAIEGSRLDERPWILLYAGEERRQLGDLDGARRHFEAVAVDFPSTAALPPAKLGMAMVDVATGQGGNQNAALPLFGSANVPASLETDRWLAVARAKADGGGDKIDVLDACRKAEDAMAGAAKDVQKRARRDIDALRAEASMPKDAAADQPDTDEALIVRVRKAIDRGDLASARTDANTLTSRFPTSAFSAEAKAAARRADRNAVPDKSVVAVLLPLTGAYALPASGLKRAIDLGIRDLGASGYTVQVHDTGGTAEGCTAALETAILDEHAAAVLGPLLREEAVPCARLAQEYHTPMLSFSNSDEPLAAGDLIFRASPSTNEQVYALLDIAAGSRGMKRFAIAHPTTPFGENAAKSFRAAAATLGVTVVMDVPYDAASKDFRTVANHLARKSAESHRYDLPGVPPVASEALGGSKVDWDGLFIPDTYGRAGLLAAALAYADVPIGGSRGAGSRGPVTLLGLNAWNNPEWPRQGGTYVRGCLFVDAFDPRSGDASVQRFVGAFGGAPTVVEATGYDAAQMLGVALHDKSLTIAEALAVAVPTAPVTGARGMSPNRAIRRDFQVLSVEGDDIVAVATAPGAP